MQLQNVTRDCLYIRPPQLATGERQKEKDTDKQKNVEKNENKIGPTVKLRSERCRRWRAQRSASWTWRVRRSQDE